MAARSLGSTEGSVALMAALIASMPRPAVSSRLEFRRMRIHSNGPFGISMVDLPYFCVVRIDHLIDEAILGINFSHKVVERFVQRVGLLPLFTNLLKQFVVRFYSAVKLEN